ncbi:hypothetical protein BO94DRAFT_586160 [Aspergillus sclerotioniger CBS 115572]|uniref:Uncharacterized protein n=1 Tax=Aspergillus sclerotioniger CBS 115572 TaxID=1450535 RepID=A0A317WKI9_9EURO|nr:hypothetical protein BO94DRAFT_586160 [Aspergillus sclerotioniger CBS 115572]PWY86575.1 hypothetical protein BO94DRAFT_586160 [Aspergillus sclerotioniger CBS 115572]
MGKFFLLAALLSLSMAASAAPVTQNKDIPLSKATAKRTNNGNSEDFWFDAYPKHASRDDNSRVSEEVWLDTVPEERSVKRTDGAQGSGISEELLVHGEH